MATGERITAEARGALVHLPRQPEAEPLHDPRQGDVDEWGRSEHIRQLARRLYDPLYRQLFRVEWEGLEKIPTEGGALLVANHAGAIPSDAPVIMHGVEEELRRPVYGLADHIFKAMPFVGTMWARAGGVAAHPENAYRLLREQQQLVLVFPEGRKGTEKLYRDRYRLRRFGRGGFVEAAMRAEAKLVPVCVVGAEEAAPIFAHVSFMQRLTGLLYFPITPTFPWLGPLGMLGYLPAKFRIRFLEPIDTRELGGADATDDKALVQTVAREIRARIQENLHDMLAKRKSVWFG